MGLFDFLKGQKKSAPDNDNLKNPASAVVVSISRAIEELGLDRFLEIDLFVGFTLDGTAVIGNDTSIKFPTEHGPQAAYIYAWTSKSQQFQVLKRNYRRALDMGSEREGDMMLPMRTLVLDHMTFHEDTIARELTAMMDWPRFHAERKRLGY